MDFDEGPAIDMLKYAKIIDYYVSEVDPVDGVIATI